MRGFPELFVLFSQFVLFWPSLFSPAWWRMPK